MTDLSDEIEAAVTTPQSASVDGRSATARQIAELIAADKYLAEKEAAEATGTSFPFRLFRTSPPGSV